MKKFLFLLIVMFYFQNMAFSQHLNDPVKDPAFNKATFLIEDDLKKNTGEIQIISQELSFDQKKALITDYEKDFTVPLLINVFAPFAIGSFYQGDTIGGVIGLAGDLTASTVMTIGLIEYYSRLLNDVENGSSSDDPMDILEDSLTYFVVGGVISTASLIFKIVRPMTYAGSYNKALKKAVPMNSKYTVQMIPDVSLTSTGNLEPSFRFKISY